MRSMQGVSSALIARNESWVRQQASAMMRRLPSNVEKADLIQAGLIGVAQAALSFVWAGDADSEEAKEAFVRYARMRVKGAMLDELRQMDHLVRSDRRSIKVLQIARERWLASHGAHPTLSELSAATGIGIDEIAQLDQAAQAVRSETAPHDAEPTDREPPGTPATAWDEVEARVDTAIVMRRLGKFFAGLPARDRQVIDAYLGIGITPTELAAETHVSQSRVSQIYKELRVRILHHLAQPEQRALDREAPAKGVAFDELVARREAELAASPTAGSWGELMEHVLTAPVGRGSRVAMSRSSASGR